MITEQAKAIRILRDALHEIAYSKNLTGTYKQFCDYLQREADAALRLTESATAAPIAAGVVPEGMAAASSAVTAIQRLDADRLLLDALTEHVKWELAMDWASEDQEWCVWNVTGSPNDREWREIGRGNSPRAAIVAALKGKP